MVDVLEIVDAEGVETAAPETEDEKDEEDSPNSASIFLFNTGHVLLATMVAPSVVRMSLMHSDRVVRHSLVRSCHGLRVHDGLNLWLLLHLLVAHLLLHAWLLHAWLLHTWLLSLQHRLLLWLSHNIVLFGLTFIHLYSII